MTAMTQQEVDAFRASKQINVMGANVPKPVRTFEEGSFPDYILSVVEKEYGPEARPTPVQSQARLLRTAPAQASTPSRHALTPFTRQLPSRRGRRGAAPAPPRGRAPTPSTTLPHSVHRHIPRLRAAGEGARASHGGEF